MLNFFCQYFTHFRGQKNNLTRNIYFCTATISNVSGQKNNLSRNIIFWRGNIFNVSGQKNNLSRNIIFWKGNIFNVSGNIYFWKGTIFVLPGKILFLNGYICKGLQILAVQKVDCKFHQPCRQLCLFNHYRISPMTRCEPRHCRPYPQ